VVPGWESPAWATGYYPEGLPESWRLAYYSNEFPSVMLPGPRWVAADEGTWDEWLTDTPVAFRFYLELTSGQDLRAIPERVRRRLTGRLWAVASGEAAAPGQPAAAAGLPLFCRVPACISAVRPPCLPAVTPPDSGAGELRRARDWLTGLRRRFGDRRVLVVLESRRATPQALRRWWELAWLLGLA
jgi:hypothetical protein